MVITSEEGTWKQYKNQRPKSFGVVLFLFASLRFQLGYKLSEIKKEKSKKVSINI